MRLVHLEAISPKLEQHHFQKVEAKVLQSQRDFSRPKGYDSCRGGAHHYPNQSKYFLSRRQVLVKLNRPLYA